MIKQLLAIVGSQGLITDEAEMRPYLTDWRDRKHGKALCVVLPRSTQEVSAVVAWAHREGQPIFTLGGNTGLCYGAVPESNWVDKPGIVLSLRRMNRVREIDLASDVMAVDAGMILADVHAAADEAGRQFPLRLGSEGSAQIGGLISTNAGGTGVLRYGPMRDLVAGLEVVLADGRVFNDMGALRKENVGYQLRQLFIGAEGTLGIVTGAVLNLHPKLAKSAHAWLDVSTPAQAVQLLALFRGATGPCIEAFELLSATQIELVRQHVERIRIPFEKIPNWSLMLELGSTDDHTDLDVMLEQTLERGLELGLINNAAVATSRQQAEDIWRVRHSVTEANKKEGVGIVHDIAVRTSQVAGFIQEADAVAAVEFPRAKTQVVCHLGDGNVHYILMFAHDYWAGLADQDAYAITVERVFHDVAARHGGTFSAEHGIGRKLPEELKRLTDPVRYELMQQIKTQLDPRNLLNPGVLLSSP